MSNRIVVGLSGGVDSSVAAYLLKKEGYDVLGVTLNMHGTIDKDAETVAKLLQIPYLCEDCTDDFDSLVIQNFSNEYKNGRTPNPCVVCNPGVKFAALYRIAKREQIDHIATGHFASVIRTDFGRYSLKRADVDLKDQTYALYRLPQNILSTLILPIGHYDKQYVREIAREAGLPVFQKHDSQEICFIPDNQHGEFLKSYLKEEYPIPGKFVDSSGNTLGKHQGIVNYTIGQRKGLNLAMGHPVYVTRIDALRNEVTIGENEDLFTTDVSVFSVSYMGTDSFSIGDRFIGKIRYGHKGAPCTITSVSENGFSVSFDEPQRAVTPGQSLVLYQDMVVMGGGIIR